MHLLYEREETHYKIKGRYLSEMTQVKYCNFYGMILYKWKNILCYKIQQSKTIYYNMVDFFQTQHIILTKLWLSLGSFRRVDFEEQEYHY